jgi:hypothetical protein
MESFLSKARKKIGEVEKGVGEGWKIFSINPNDRKFHIIRLYGG